MPINPSNTRRPQIAETITGNLPMALVGGACAAVASALVWGGLTKALDREFGLLAIGVGFLCGMAVQLMGKGETINFRLIGAASSVAGIVLGKLFAIHLLVQEHVPGGIGLGNEISFLKETFSPIDVLFYAIAVWEGWKFSVASEE